MGKFILSRTACQETVFGEIHKILLVIMAMRNLKVIYGSFTPKLFLFHLKSGIIPCNKASLQGYFKGGEIRLQL